MNKEKFINLFKNKNMETKESNQPQLAFRKFSIFDKITMFSLVGIMLLVIVGTAFASGDDSFGSGNFKDLSLVDTGGLTDTQREQIEARQDEKSALQLEAANYDVQIAQLQQNVEMVRARIQELDWEMAQIKLGKTITGTGQADFR